MGRSLSEVLQDPLVLKDLLENPDTFSFKEAPTLILTMVSYPPHTFLNSEDTDSETVRAGIPTNFPIAGPMAYILQILKTSMNFTYRQILPPDGGFGVKTPTGNWTGMVGQLVRKEADVCLGPMQVIQSRTEFIDYTMPFSFGTLSLMAARGSATIDPWSFVLPLNGDVWMALFVAMLVVSILHATFQRLMQPRANWFVLFGEALFDYSQPPMGNSIEKEIRNWQRPLFGAWLFTAFLLNASYEGTLRSMMALKYIPHPVQTVQDVIQNPNMKIIVMHRTSYTDVMSKVPSGDVRLLDDAGKAGRYVDRNIGDFMNYYDLVLRGDHVQIFDVITSLRYFALYFSNTGRCDFYIAKEKFIPTMYGMTLQKKSPLTDAFNARIIRVFEAGLYNQWTKREVDNYTACLNPPIKVTSQDPIAFKNIWVTYRFVDHPTHLSDYCNVCNVHAATVRLPPFTSKELFA
ncbi:glutamate receptor ionotropic, delta-2-like [Palaemon carinicauda]|uniref:glutamate receptor ionotropic, delta-2-like n=1 Tax=Palaemon carinicauda TaxID=392227 RepID=UPI0035B5A640